MPICNEPRQAGSLDFLKGHKMQDIAAQLRQHAATVRTRQDAREAIANGFDLIAAAMEPTCVDCAAQKHAAPDQEIINAGGTD